MVGMRRESGLHSDPEAIMQTLSLRRLGFALGAGFALVYLGCVFVMLTAPKEAAIRFFNSILHGVDVTTIMRWTSRGRRCSAVCWRCSSSVGRSVRSSRRSLI